MQKNDLNQRSVNDHYKSKRVRSLKYREDASPYVRASLYYMTVIFMHMDARVDQIHVVLSFFFDVLA